MSERKNIDKLFQEQFKDFEASPPEHTWDELERRLKKKKDRKILPIWWRLAGVAAVLVIGLTVGSQMGWLGEQSFEPEQNQVVVQDPALSDTIGSSDLKNSLDPAVVGDSTNHSDATRLVQTDSEAHPAQTQDNADLPAGHNSDVSHASPQKKVVKQTSVKNRTNDMAPTTRTAVAERQSLPSDRKAGKRSVSNAKTDRQVLAESGVERSGNNHSQTSQQLLPDGKRDAVAQSDQNKNTPPVNAKHNVLSTNDGVAQSDVRHTEKNKDKTAKAASNETAIAQKNLDAKSSEAATTRGTDELANGNQKADPNQKPTTTVINQVAAAEEHQKKLDSTAIATVPNALEELLNEKENKVTKEPKLNRWQITSNIAPIYFGSTSGGSPIDSTFSGKSKQYDTQVSYGIGASYAISKRLSVRTGVNKVALSYDTNDVELYASIDNGGLKNVDMPAGNETLNFGRNRATARGGEANRTQSVTASGELATDKFSGTVNQKMGYIEVPVELSYALIDKKFGLNVIAGVSTLFLSDNQIVLTSDGLKTDLGKANNLNQTHFSSNVGLGIKYRFLKSFEANFEPIFKYQINTFSKESGDFKPYFFGLYTGLSFRF